MRQVLLHATTAGYLAGEDRDDGSHQPSFCASTIYGAAARCRTGYWVLPRRNTFRLGRATEGCSRPSLAPRTRHRAFSDASATGLSHNSHPHLHQLTHSRHEVALFSGIPQSAMSREGLTLSAAKKKKGLSRVGGDALDSATFAAPPSRPAQKGVFLRLVISASLSSYY